MGCGKAVEVVRDQWSPQCLLPLVNANAAPCLDGLIAT